jgi:hypothetical protein
VEQAYWRALGRAPTPRETELSLAFLKKRAASPKALADFCHAVLNLNEFVYVP